MLELLLLAIGCAPPAPPPPEGPPNILLVSLDTLRADHTGPYGYARATTPTLDRLAAQGTTFTRAFAQGNESAWSHGALFTGRYASELAAPVYETWALPPTATLVSEALSAYGYRTGAFVAGGHVTDDFGFDQGWTHFQAEHGFASLFETGPPALAWIEAQPTDAPWFAFVHTYDTHRPYTRVGPWDHLWADGPGSRLAELVVRSPCLSELVFRDALFPEMDPTWFQHSGGDRVMDPEVYRKLARGEAGRREVRLTDADRRHVVDHYDGAVQYADALLGLFLARLEAAGRLDHTVIIVVSDHGEDLLDHGYMNHRTALTDSCTKVPTLVSGPGFTPGARVDGLVDARDVAATVVALAGALPPAGMEGRDLRAVARGEDPLDVVYSEGVMDMVSARSATHRLVYDEAALSAPDWVDRLEAAPLDAPAFELYDVVADPGEQVNLLATPDDTARAVAGRLRDGLVAWRRSLTVGAFAADPTTVSPQVRARLREHGYWKAEGEDEAPPGPDAASPADPTPSPASTQCRERLLFLDEAGG